MKELLNLGELYVSDFVKEGQTPRSGKHELKLIMDDEIKAPRLNSHPKMEEMYGKYWYRSGINQTMKNELKEITDSIFKIIDFKEKDLWVDIACNDGTLLSFLPEKLLRVGIDPADDSFVKESEKHSDLIIQDFFSEEVFTKSIYGNLRARVITCIAMFYDTPNPKKFLNDIYNILDDEGIVVLQLSYTPLMIIQNAFDNICHEHIWYYSLGNIMNLLEECNLSILNCELNDVNGGSFRVYCVKKDCDKTKLVSQQFIDVANYRINSMLELEKKLQVDSTETWEKLSDEIESLKNKTLNFIKEKKQEGKTIWAYGASTKGNTLLQYFGLDNTLIDGIADRSEYKWGTKTVGTNIPIYSEFEMRKVNPDYLLVLPWHFINEFVKRENDFLQNGGTFIVPCPKFKLISL